MNNQYYALIASVAELPGSVGTATLKRIETTVLDGPWAIQRTGSNLEDFHQPWSTSGTEMACRMEFSGTNVNFLPEPSSWVLMGLGSCLVVLFRGGVPVGFSRAKRILAVALVSMAAVGGSAWAGDKGGKSSGGGGSSRFYNSGGRLTGKTTTQGGQTRVYSPGGRLVGKSATANGTTRFYTPGGTYLGKKTTGNSR